MVFFSSLIVIQHVKILIVILLNIFVKSLET